jgi:hypothetical protein
MRIAQRPIYTHHSNALVTSIISTKNNSEMITGQEINN